MFGAIMNNTVAYLIYFVYKLMIKCFITDIQFFHVIISRVIKTCPHMYTGSQLIISAGLILYTTKRNKSID